MDSVRHDNINIYFPQARSNRFVLFVSVPSENKRDMRTIEDVQADIQAKKKLKLSQTSATTVEPQPNAE